MKNQTVAISACRRYDAKLIKEALLKTIEGIGGLEPYLEKGRTVLLKINLILGKAPDRHATTHPAFVEALAQILTEYGMQVILGDSPGGPFNTAALRHVYKATGMAEMAERCGIRLNENTGSIEVENPSGKFMKRLTMTAMLQDADYVISVCKLKTHSMMTYTGAAKNLFGTVPGTVKADYHVRMPDAMDFADALVDICEAADPVLSFMDAIVGMEGNGPTAGTPRPIGAVLASPNPYALDTVASGIIGLKPEQIPLLKQAMARGLLDPARVQTAGEDPQTFFIADYKMPDHIESDLYRMKLPSWLAAPLTKLTRAKVRFDPKACVGCGICRDNCPAEVITMRESDTYKGRRPQVDYKKCIRCFCCQELCPQEAVTVQESFIYRIANKL